MKLPAAPKECRAARPTGGSGGLEHVAIVAVDPQRGAELGVRRPRLAALLDGDDLEDLLAALVADRNRRLNVLAEVGEPKVTEIDLPVFPMIVLVLDELAELLAGGITREEARDGQVGSLLRLLVAKGDARCPMRDLRPGPLGKRWSSSMRPGCGMNVNSLSIGFSHSRHARGSFSHIHRATSVFVSPMGIGLCSHFHRARPVWRRLVAVDSSTKGG